MTELEWVFAYGSNMHLEDLRAWMVERGHSPDGIKSIVRASLRDHRLVWNYLSKSRQGGAANVEVAPGHVLPGIALQVDAAALAAIDLKEGHPNVYSRGTRTYEVITDRGPVAAWVYVVTPEYCKPTEQWPTRAYRDLLVSAAIMHGLPAEHVAYLESIRVQD